MGGFHAKALADLGYTITTVDPDPRRGATHRTVPRRRYDVAAIAAPPATLPALAGQVAPHATRLLVEKPVALTLQQAEGLARDLGGKNVCAGFIERFNPRARELRRRLPIIGRPVNAHFVRWSDRPTWNTDVDLRIHDVDLAHWLELDCPVTYDTRAADRKRRIVTISGTHGTLTADLMAHSLSPLHALWHAFLTGQDVPTLDDAVHAHRALTAECTIAA
jgi:hypothetical protein